MKDPGAPGPGNNFDALRLGAASMVVLGHSFILVGLPPHAALGHSVSTLAVLIFFAISGYLVAGSWLRDPHPGRFALRRARRILPALAAVVLISVLVLGPVLTPLPFGDYALHAQTLRYLGNAILYVSYTLPLVFAENHYPHAVNGSLWTLPVEATMYALTPVLMLLGRWRPALLAALALAAGLAAYALAAAPREVVIGGTGFWSAAMLAPYFVAGAAVARFRLERWLDPRLGLAALAVLQIAPLGAVPREMLLILALPYAALAVALRSWPVLRRAGRFGDASYGIYLWSFPVQQTVVHVLGTAGGGWANVAVALPVSVILGLLSWHMLEKHALHRGGRPGVRRIGPPLALPQAEPWRGSPG